MSTSSNDGQAKGYILVVDDELALVRAYAQTLIAAGYRVERASDGAAARQLLESQRFDAIISDVWMPGLDGIELLREVRRHDLDVPVVLITGAPSAAGAASAMEYGALLYLCKPVNFPMLVQVIDNACRLHRMARLKREAVVLLGTGDQQLGDRAGLEGAFTRALRSLSMAYEPIVHLATRSVYGYEALVRTGEALLPNPVALLKAAERLGRVQDLGRTIRKHVAASLTDGPGLPMFVNLHPHELADPALLWEDAPLSRFASRVVLELSERASLADVNNAFGAVVALRAMGFRIALDDVGAGYAGLTSFAQFQPDVIKLDGALIREVHCVPVKRKLVGSMIAVSHELDIQVIAEGVETEAERDALAELGCDLFQGYLAAKPW